MSSLNERLREIIGKNFTWEINGIDGIRLKKVSVNINLDDEAIAQIKQAFAEETGITTLDWIKEQGYAKVRKDRYRYVTGQEWYELFVEELEKSVNVNRRTQDFTDAILVAQKASGIEDDK